MISLLDSAAVYDVPPLKEWIFSSRCESSFSFSHCWKAKLDEIRKLNPKGNNEHEPKILTPKTALKLEIFSFNKLKLNGVSTLQENDVLQNSKPAKFCQQII